ncbi:hypothetical protein CPLU01_12058 [Colletotrichum plurivorum]|uniref:Uncharacterized protein n=1 Tax=Colletotrichum plurivorum TaxID=2175906 RepID=A0A8H6N7L3_9PEZI|nr:hypothetical protein CPLU01_12058 [Colletotrichum plurivorum]
MQLSLLVAGARSVLNPPGLIDSIIKAHRAAGGLKASRRADIMGSTPSVSRARHSGVCTLLIFVVACVVALSFLKGSSLHNTGGSHERLNSRLAVQSREKDNEPAKLPPVKYLTEPKDSFYASDLLSNLEEQKHNAHAGSRPQDNKMSGQGAGDPTETDFYASDALSRAEKKAKQRGQ